MIEDYSHMDCWIGEYAARDVFPIVADALDQLN